MLTGDVSAFDELSQSALRQLVISNTPALTLVRTGLTFTCQVPMNFSPTDQTNQEHPTPFSSHLAYISSLKNLARALAAEGRLAELDSRPDDAAKCYLDVVGLGIQAARGGMIIDSLVGIAVQAIGQARLTRLVPSLSAVGCRAVAANLESSLAQEEPTTAVLQRDLAWGRHNYGVRGQLTLLLNYRSHRATVQGWLGRVKSQQLALQRLLLDVAARAYELEKGARPRTIEDLVPAYLKVIPQDPMTGTNVVFR